MTPAPMIAVMVILVAILIALTIGIIFYLLEKSYEKKQCHYLCCLCEYREECDWYTLYKIKKQKKNRPQK